MAVPLLRIHHRSSLLLLLIVVCIIVSQSSSFLNFMPLTPSPSPIAVTQSAGFVSSSSCLDALKLCPQGDLTYRGISHRHRSVVPSFQPWFSPSLLLGSHSNARSSSSTSTSSSNSMRRPFRRSFQVLFADAVTALTCGITNPVPATADDYTLTDCPAAPTTTISIAPGTFTRRIFVRSTSAGTRCFVNSIVTTGAVANLIVDLQGVSLSCATSCIDFSSGAITAVSVQSQSNANALTNQLSATTSAILVGSATGLTVILKDFLSASTGSSSFMRLNAAVASSSLVLANGVFNTGVSDFLYAGGSLTNFEFQVNPSLTATTVTITSGGALMTTVGSVVTPLRVYLGPGTTVSLQATSLCAFCMPLSGATVTITQAALLMPSGVTTHRFFAAETTTMSTATISIMSTRITTSGYVLSAGTVTGLTFYAHMTGASTASMITCSGSLMSSAVTVTGTGTTITTSTLIAAPTMASCSAVTFSGLTAVGCSLTMTTSVTDTSISFVSTKFTSTGCVFRAPLVQNVQLALSSVDATITGGSIVAVTGPVSGLQLSGTSSVWNADSAISIAGAATGVTLMGSSLTLQSGLSTILLASTSVNSDVSVSVSGSSTWTSSAALLTMSGDLTNFYVTMVGPSAVISTARWFWNTPAMMQTVRVSMSGGAVISAGGVSDSVFVSNVMIDVRVTLVGATTRITTTAAPAFFSLTGDATTDHSVTVIQDGASFRGATAALVTAASRSVALTVTMSNSAAAEWLQLTKLTMACILDADVVVTGSGTALTIAGTTTGMIASSGRVNHLGFQVIGGASLRTSTTLFSLTGASLTHTSLQVTLDSLPAGTSLLNVPLIVAATTSTLSSASFTLTNSPITVAIASLTWISIGSATGFTVSTSGWTFTGTSAVVAAGTVSSAQWNFVSSTSISTSQETFSIVGAVVGLTITSTASTFRINAKPFLTFVGDAAQISVVGTMASSFACSSASDGFIKFASTSSDVSVSLSASSVQVSVGPLLNFVGLNSVGASVSVLSSTITVTNAALLVFAAGYTGASSLVISASTISVVNFLWYDAHNNVATPAGGSTLLLTGSTLAITSSSSEPAPAVLYMRQAPTLVGVSWTLSQSTILHTIPVPPASPTFSLIYILNTAVSMINSVFPAVTVDNVIVTSTHAQLTGFTVLRLQGSSFQGASPPYGEIVIQRLQLSTATTKRQLLVGDASSWMNKMTVSMVCFELPATDSSPIALDGEMREVVFQWKGFALRTTYNVIPAMALPSTISSYVTIAFTSTLMHTPSLVRIGSTNNLQLSAGCSWASPSYAMSANSFGTSLASFFLGKGCEHNPFPRCIESITPSSSQSLSDKNSASRSQLPTFSRSPRVSHSLTNQSRSQVLSVSRGTPSDENSASRSPTLSLSKELTHTKSPTEERSATTTNGTSLSTSLSFTTTVSREDTLSLSPEESFSPTTTDSLSQEGSKTRTFSLSLTGSESGTWSRELSASRTYSESTDPTQTGSYSVSEERSTTPTITTSLSPTGKSQTLDASLSRSVSFSFETSISDTVTSSESLTLSFELSSTDSTTNTQEQSVTSSESLTGSRSFSDEPSFSSSISFSPQQSVTWGKSVSSLSTTLSEPTATRDFSSTQTDEESRTFTSSKSPSRGTQTKSEGTASSDRTLSETISAPTSTMAHSKSITDSMSVSFQESASRSASVSMTDTMSDTAGTPTQERSESVSETFSGSASASFESTPSESTTATFSDSDEQSFSFSWTSEPTFTVRSFSETAPFSSSESDTEIRSVTTSDERTMSVSENRSFTDSQTVSEDLTVSLVTGSFSASSEQTNSPSSQRSVSWLTLTPTSTFTMGGLTSTVSVTESRTGHSAEVTPSNGTHSLTLTWSKATPSSSLTETFTPGTPSSTNSPSQESSQSVSNSSSKGSKSISPSGSPSEELLLTASATYTSDETLTVTSTITPPPTATRWITPSRPVIRDTSNLQSFSDFLRRLSFEDSCTMALWYILVICAAVFLLELLVLLVLYLMGRMYDKHPDTDGVSVLRSLVARSTYLSVVMPCHRFCAVPHMLVAISHVAMIVVLFYILTNRLAVTSDSVVTLRVFVVLAAAAAPHLISNALFGKLLFLYRFTKDEMILEKYWLKYCDMTGRHQSKVFFPDVTDDMPFEKVLELSRRRRGVKDPTPPTSPQRSPSTTESSDSSDGIFGDDEDPVVMRVEVAKRVRNDENKPKKNSHAKSHPNQKQQPTTDKGSKNTFRGHGKESGTPNGTAPPPRHEGRLTPRNITNQLDDISSSGYHPFPSEYHGDHSNYRSGEGILLARKTPPRSAQTTTESALPGQIGSGNEFGEFTDDLPSFLFDDSETEGGAPPHGNNNNNTANGKRGGLKGGGRGGVGDLERRGTWTTVRNEQHDLSNTATEPEGVESLIGGLDLSFGGSFSSRDEDDDDLGDVVEDDGDAEEEQPLQEPLEASVAHAPRMPTVSSMRLPHERSGFFGNSVNGARRRQSRLAFLTPRSSNNNNNDNNHHKKNVAEEDEDDGMERHEPLLSVTETGSMDQFFELQDGAKDPFAASSSEDDDGEDLKKPSRLETTVSPTAALFQDDVPADAFLEFEHIEEKRREKARKKELKEKKKRKSLSLTAVSAADVNHADVVDRAKAKEERDDEGYLSTLHSGAVTYDKSVQQMLEDRFEKLSDDWSIPSTSDSSDTDGDDEEGREYFPVPVEAPWNLRVAILALLVFVGCAVLLYFAPRYFTFTSQDVCVTDLLLVVFLVDFFVIEPLLLLLILVGRIWFFDDDGSRDALLDQGRDGAFSDAVAVKVEPDEEEERPPEGLNPQQIARWRRKRARDKKRSFGAKVEKWTQGMRESWREWGAAVRSTDNILHPYPGELKPHMLPPLKQGIRRPSTQQAAARRSHDAHDSPSPQPAPTSGAAHALAHLNQFPKDDLFYFDAPAKPLGKQHQEVKKRWEERQYISGDLEYDFDVYLNSRGGTPAPASPQYGRRADATNPTFPSPDMYDNDPRFVKHGGGSSSSPSSNQKKGSVKHR